MAGRGPAPKDPEKRERRNATLPMTDLAATAPPAARPLPRARQHHPRTRRWWKLAAAAPQAAQFLETDWLVMERLADLYDAFFEGSTSVASEIRLCEAKLGFTPEDRQRLRWQWRSAGDEPPASAASDGPSRSSSRGRKDPRLTAIEGGKAS